VFLGVGHAAHVAVEGAEHCLIDALGAGILGAPVEQGLHAVLTKRRQPQKRVIFINVVVVVKACGGS
jgi:hypothetical protein